MTKQPLTYGKYTLAEFNAKPYAERVRIAHEYHMKIWRKQWKAQAKLVRLMGIPGSQLQEYRA